MRAALPSALALALVAGCGTGRAGRPSPAGPSSTGTTRVESGDSGQARAAPPPAVVVLLSPGTGPRRPLRSVLRDQATELAVWELSVRMTLSVGQMQPPEVRPPTVRLHVRSTVSEVDETGEAIVETIIEQVDVVPGSEGGTALEGSLNTALQPLTQTRIAAAVGPLGRVERVTFRPTDAPAPQLTTTLEAIRQALTMLPPCPPDPVGRGARWRVESHPHTPLLSLDQLAEYRLPDVTAGPARVLGVLRQAAMPQAIALPNLPPGAKVTLKTLAGNGTVRSDRGEREIYGALEGKLVTKVTATVEGPDEPSRELRMETAYDVRFLPRR